MDYLMMVPALILVGVIVAVCLPLARRRKNTPPHAEKEQMDQPQEEFRDDQRSN